MTLYRMYGLTAESHWSLPECLPVAQGAEPDIHIIKGLVPAAGIDAASEDAWEQSIEVPLDDEEEPSVWLPALIPMLLKGCSYWLSTPTRRR